MTISYSTLGGSVSINPTGSVSSGDLNTSIALVGGYDDANASTEITEDTASVVTSSTEAENLFGANSELAKQTALAIANGAGLIYAIPRSATNTTESFTASASGTIAATPIADPRVTTSTLTVTDTTAATDLDVTVVDGTPNATETDTAEVNVNTGAWDADASSDYDITFESANFTDALVEAASKPVRYVGACTEYSGAITTIQTELKNNAGDFRFARSVVGATPGIAPADIGSYTPETDDWRVIEVASARGTDNNGNAVRTAGAIAGLLANQPIDVSGSITYDEVSGMDSLATAYAPSEVQLFDRVTAITDTGEVAEGVTTATEGAFSDIYKAELIDFVVEQLHERIKSYRGGSNTAGAQKKFRSRLKRTLNAQTAPEAQPPLLADGEGGRPYSLSVQSANNDTVANAIIGIDPAPIAKQVNLDVSVGPIQFNGASVQ